MKNYESLADALANLKSRGYDTDFATTSDCLYCSDVDIRLNPEEFTVDESYHFPLGPNSNEACVLFAITSHTGVKGFLVDGFRANAVHLNFQEVHKIHTHHSVFI